MKLFFEGTQLAMVKVYFLRSFIPRRDLVTGHLFTLIYYYLITLLTYILVLTKHLGSGESSSIASLLPSFLGALLDC